MIKKVEGLAELDRALGELPKTTARAVLQRVGKKALEPVREKMEANAPRDTGYTANSIAISTRVNRSQRGQVKRDGKNFAEVYVGSRRGSAAVLQEFGTARQSAHPYLRPAWDSTHDEVLKLLGEQLGAEIQKAAARLAKKAAKGR